jgi:hypothetical protein
MENKDWRQECARLQIELDSVRVEMEEWKEKWERLMKFKDAPRFPVKGLTTMGYRSGDDGK